MDFCLGRECSLAMASKNVKCGSRDQVTVCDQWDLVGTLALVGDFAIQGRFGFSVGVNGNLQFEPDGERKADDIEAGTNVG